MSFCLNLILSSRLIFFLLLSVSVCVCACVCVLRVNRLSRSSNVVEGRDECGWDTHAHAHTQREKRWERERGRREGCVSLEFWIPDREGC